MLWGARVPNLVVLVIPIDVLGCTRVITRVPVLVWIIRGQIPGYQT